MQHINFLCVFSPPTDHSTGAGVQTWEPDTQTGEGDGCLDGRSAVQVYRTTGFCRERWGANLVHRAKRTYFILQVTIVLHQAFEMYMVFFCYVALSNVWLTFQIIFIDISYDVFLLLVNFLEIWLTFKVFSYYAFELKISLKYILTFVVYASSFSIKYVLQRNTGA